MTEHYVTNDGQVETTTDTTTVYTSGSSQPTATISTVSLLDDSNGQDLGTTSTITTGNGTISVEGEVEPGSFEETPAGTFIFNEDTTLANGVLVEAGHEVQTLPNGSIAVESAGIGSVSYYDVDGNPISVEVAMAPPEEVAESDGIAEGAEEDTVLTPPASLSVSSENYIPAPPQVTMGNGGWDAAAAALSSESGVPITGAQLQQAMFDAGAQPANVYSKDTFAVIDGQVVYFATDSRREGWGGEAVANTAQVTELKGTPPTINAQAVDGALVVASGNGPETTLGDIIEEPFVSFPIGNTEYSLGNYYDPTGESNFGAQPYAFTVGDQTYEGYAIQANGENIAYAIGDVVYNIDGSVMATYDPTLGTWVENDQYYVIDPDTGNWVLSDTPPEPVA